MGLAAQRERELDSRIVRDIKLGLGSATGHVKDVAEEGGVVEDVDDSDWEEVYAFVVETGSSGRD